MTYGRYSLKWHNLLYLHPIAFVIALCVGVGNVVCAPLAGHNLQICCVSSSKWCVTIWENKCKMFFLLLFHHTHCFYYHSSFLNTIVACTARQFFTVMPYKKKRIWSKLMRTLVVFSFRQALSDFRSKNIQSHKILHRFSPDILWIRNLSCFMSIVEKKKFNQIKTTFPMNLIAWWWCCRWWSKRKEEKLSYSCSIPTKIKSYISCCCSYLGFKSNIFCVCLCYFCSQLYLK